MLDLTQFKHKTFDVRLPDGQKVKLKKPTQRFALDLTAIANADVTDLEEIFDNIIGSVVKMLNHNEAGLVFSEQYVEDNFNLDMCLALVNGYIDFMAELTDEKN